MIECPKCGHENALGRLHCDSCGQRLDISRVRPSIDERPLGRRRRKKRGGKRSRRRVRWLLGVVLLAALVAVPLLAAWRPAVPEPRVSMEQVARYRNTRESLRRLMVGQGATVGVLQDDVNSHIAYVRRLQPETPRVVVSFRDDGVRAFVGKKLLRVEFIVTFRWAVGGGDTPAFRPASVAVGRLPLPVAAFPWAARQFPEALRAFETEFRILNNCVSARVPAEGRLVLEVRFRS